MKKIQQLVVMTMIMSVVLASCSKKTDVAGTVDSGDTVTVRTATVGVQTIADDYEYSALVRAEAVNNIAPSTPGRIENIFVEIGDYVVKGQKLIQMDATMLRQSRTQLNNQEKNFERFEELYKVGGISKAEYDAQKTQLDIARNNIKTLEENTQLLSPISGVVTMRNYDSGDLYAGNPILQVQQISPVKLLINISESQYTLVKKGMKANVKLDVFPNEVFVANISLIYPTLDPRTHTFTAEVSLPNKNSKVRPGMYGKVYLNFGATENVVVPEQAIVKITGSPDRYVYLVDGDKVVYTKVELGRRLENGYEVLSGLKNGDQVAITSLLKLKNGTTIKIVQ
ncbi:MAG TPA: efflux RND transporter periplasmic adaptor subunit [Bacteroidales bacterium]|jgi:RND family efflux transporter MFP subunit|nr:efflux RND transporter periplasmic adaptor subunit [Bacteroidales bacterium]HPE40209.1 efflux RND transporter periplasmic adaptor subunit [Bacteroidales bacterium]